MKLSPRGGLTAALIIALIACGGGAPKPPPAAPSPASGSTTVSTAGGTVTSASGIVLEVPPGALASETAIRITATDVAAPADAGPVTKLVKFEPAGLEFAQPVTVTFPIPDGTSEASIYWSNEDGSGFAPLPTFIAGKTLVATTTHFSSAFLGTPVGVQGPPGPAGPQGPAGAAGSGGGLKLVDATGAVVGSANLLSYRSHAGYGDNADYFVWDSTQHVWWEVDLFQGKLRAAADGSPSWQEFLTSDCTGSGYSYFETPPGFVVAVWAAEPDVGAPELKAVPTNLSVVFGSARSESFDGACQTTTDSGTYSFVESSAYASWKTVIPPTVAGAPPYHLEP